MRSCPVASESTPTKQRRSRGEASAHGAKENQVASVESAVFQGVIQRQRDRTRSGVAQLVDVLCFGPDAPLYDEFDRLFASLFEHAGVHETLIREIARKRGGVSRGELVAKTGLSSGGSLKRRLDELEVVLVNHGEGLEIYLELDRKSGGLLGFLSDALEMDETKVHLTIDDSDLEDLTEKVAQLIDAHI